MLRYSGGHEYSLACSAWDSVELCHQSLPSPPTSAAQSSRLSRPMTNQSVCAYSWARISDPKVSKPNGYCESTTTLPSEYASPTAVGSEDCLLYTSPSPRD